MEIEGQLEHWWASVRGKAAAWASQAFPALLALDASGLDSARIPQLFSRKVRQIPPRLNDDLLDLYGSAAALLDNRFAFFHRLHKFGPEIDWAAPETSAWREELHAFDYALDLALTYRISGEDVYARHLRYLVAHWIASNPPARGPGWLPAVVARRMRNWILAADLARTDWERDTEFFQVVRGSLALQSTFLQRRAPALQSVPETLDASRALLLARRFFLGTGALEFRSHGLDLLRKAFDSYDAARSAWPSLQMHIANAVLDWILFDAEGAQRNELLDMLRQVLSHLEGLLLPGGVLPRFGPAGRAGETELANLAALAAVTLADPLWKDIAGEFGILPYLLLGERGQQQFESLSGAAWRAQNRFEPPHGIYRLAGSDGSALVVCARDGSSQDRHEDLLSFELSLQGQRVVVDSGAYTSEPDQYFSSAQAHNLLLIDSRAPGEQVARRLVRPEEAWEFQASRTRLKLQNLGVPGLTQERFWFCLDGKYWAVVDRVVGAGKHHIRSLLHFFPTFDLQREGGKILARSRACSVTIVPLSRSSPNTVMARGDNPELTGWYAPDLGIKYPASVLALDWESVELPWAGGYLLLPGEMEGFRVGSVDAEAKAAEFEVGGKAYLLSLR